MFSTESVVKINTKIKTVDLREKYIKITQSRLIKTVETVTYLIIKAVVYSRIIIKIT